MREAIGAPEETVREQAIVWFARVRSGRINAQERERLLAWLNNPTHAEAFKALDAKWGWLGKLRSHPEILELRDRAARSASLAVWRRVAGVAALAACVVGLALFAERGSFSPQPGPALLFASPIGQRMTVVLADGSTVMLDSGGRIRVVEDDDSRHIDLMSGRAFFHVHKDQNRPFVVAADGKSVTALGTEFTVDVGTPNFTVVLLRGRVRVADEPRKDAPQQAVEMEAGRQLVVAAGAWTLTAADLNSSTAWMSGRLIFRNARLGDVAAELNRYTPGKIKIAADGTADKRIGAVLQAGDVDTFVESVKVSRLARATHETDGGVVLHQ